MGHAVHYRTSAGETRFEEAESLDAALGKVERLRNDDGVSDVRVYREVPIAFKAYYTVTVAEEGGADAPAPDPVVLAPAPAPAADEPPPGAMPLGSSAPAAKVNEETLDADGEVKRGSLFSRG